MRRPRGTRGRVPASAPFRAIQLNNCVLWLRGDLGVTDSGDGECNQWDDQSTNADSFTQGTDALEPPIVSSSSAFKNNPVLDFEAADYVLDTTWARTDNSAGHTLVLVLAKDDTSVGQRRAYHQSGVNMTVDDLGPTYRCYVDSATNRGTMTVNDTNAHIVIFRFDGSGSDNSERLRGWLDGTEQSLTYSGTIPATLGTDTEASVGAKNDGTIPFDGKIAEVAAYSRALMVAEIAKWSNYASSRYGV